MAFPKAAPHKARQLYRACEAIHLEARHYSYGGGHATRLRDLHGHSALDCSSSVYLALWRADLYTGTYASTSGTLMAFGLPGKGTWATIWASPQHTWIQFHHLGRYWRFDTSPWGSGGLGPRMRMLPRSTRGFTPRHAIGT